MLLGEVAAGDAVLVDVYYRAEGGGDGDGGEDGAGGGGVEGVVGAVDEGDGGEGEVEDGPGEGDPEGEEEDDGLAEMLANGKYGKGEGSLLR